MRPVSPPLPGAFILCVRIPGEEHITWAQRSHVRFGSKADMCGATSHVRFAPNSDRKSGFPQTVMSALPPKADMCGALADVCYGPEAEVAVIRSVEAIVQPGAKDTIGERAMAIASF